MTATSRSFSKGVGMDGLHRQSSMIFTLDQNRMKDGTEYQTMYCASLQGGVLILGLSHI
ncbi:predicted protein [Botrytis cinerea T4]|uniref:Uncharacterized protein n=1 Tax=Botryotinia fuckeliana (strain T4) TaxID=999810 RepID=G2YYR8_BOTF4|nr:predicted protein [Botrytis cinerea T4]